MDTTEVVGSADPPDFKKLLTQALEVGGISLAQPISGSNPLSSAKFSAPYGVEPCSLRPIGGIGRRELVLTSRSASRTRARCRRPHASRCR
jgi:hypothetical protein